MTKTQKVILIGFAIDAIVCMTILYLMGAFN